jgi:hypothetical protein
MGQVAWFLEMTGPDRDRVLRGRAALGSVKDALVHRHERGEVITCGQFETVRGVITKKKRRR